MTVHACTIVARNYLPFARVLATTFREQHPDGRLTVLVVDDVFGEVDPAVEPFEVLRITDLHGDQEDLFRMAVLYDVVGYSTAVKPWLLRTLLDRGAPSVLYLDPDIAVFDSLEELGGLAGAHELVLTPHATSPMPRYGKMASETSILASGVYNLGFVGVGTRSDAFLAFWQERLRRDCTNDPPNMRFVDQRWVDFAPGMFDAAIVRDPTYNVAYWNLDHRRLAWTGERYEVENRPLRFFHFSGYKPTARYLLSSHQIDRPRILLSEHPDLLRLCDAYGDLLEAHGYGRRAAPEYALGRMANGVPIDDCVRRYLTDWIEEADDGERPYPPSPFDEPGAEALCDWLNEVGEVTAGPARLTRYLALYWASLPGLRSRFPDPQGVHHDELMLFLQDEAAAGRVHTRMVPVAGAEAAAPEGAGDMTASAEGDLTDLSLGVNVAGYLRAELGVGEGARLLISALEAVDVPYRVRVSTRTLNRQNHPFEVDGSAAGGFGTSVISVNADQLPAFAAEAGSEFFEGRYTIGQWAWELEEFPDEWPEAFDLVDEIWATSEFTRKAIAAATDKPVFAVPHPIVAPPVPAGIDRGSLGLPEGRFLFLFAFDLLSVPERKNPLGLIEAFRRAFGPEEGPVLVLKIINGERRMRELEQIRLTVADRPDILLVNRYLDVDQQAGLMQLADCYVSLHRSEGFGLTMAEAMALGKPVIATGYSGNLDFMNAETAYLVRWTEVAVPADCDPYPEGAVWADPDLDDAARLLRYVVEHPDEAIEVGRRARESVLVDHGPKTRGLFIRERLEVIERLRPSQDAPTHRIGGDQAMETGSRHDEVPPSMLLETARSRPSLESVAGRFPNLARFYRRVVLRAQRHHDDHQRRVNVTLAEAIDQVHEEAELGFSRLEGAVRSLAAELSRSRGAHDGILRAQAARLNRLAPNQIIDESPKAGSLPDERPSRTPIDLVDPKVDPTSISTVLPGGDETGRE